MYILVITIFLLAVIVGLNIIIYFRILTKKINLEI